MIASVVVELSQGCRDREKEGGRKKEEEQRKEGGGVNCVKSVKVHNDGKGREVVRSV